MSKSEFNWSVIRVIGLLCLVVGVTRVFDAFTAWLITSGGELRLNWGTIFILFFGTYGLFFGKGAHVLLMRESYLLGIDLSEVDTADGGLFKELSEQDQSAFRLWQQYNPEHVHRPMSEQIAFFREDQAGEQAE